MKTTAVTEMVQGEEKPKRGTKGTQRHVGGKKGARKASGLLRDMRYVYSTPGVEGGVERTEGRRQCRRWLESNQSSFLSKMAELEKAHRAEGAKSGVPAKGEGSPGLLDDGEVRVAELIDRLLAEWKQTAEDGK